MSECIWSNKKLLTFALYINSAKVSNSYVFLYGGFNPPEQQIVAHFNAKSSSDSEDFVSNKKLFAGFDLLAVCLYDSHSN